MTPVRQVERWPLALKIFPCPTELLAINLLMFSEEPFSIEMTTPATPTENQARLHSVQAEAHPFCTVCSRSNPNGFGLKFVCQPDGSVSTTFLGDPAQEGFHGVLHGGVIASLLDGAMTNCLFALGRTAMTGELNVRYREPVAIGEEMFIRAWITNSLPPLHLLAAELKQGNESVRRDVKYDRKLKTNVVKKRTVSRR